MRTSVLAALMLAWAAAATTTWAQEDAQKHALILAAPRDVTLVKDLSGQTPDGGLYYGGRFKVTLKKIHVVWGPTTIPDNLTVELTAAHKENLTNKAVIFVLLALDAIQKPRVLSWGYTQTVACVPHNIVEGTDMEKYFVSLHRFDDNDCANVEPTY